MNIFDNQDSETAIEQFFIITGKNYEPQNAHVLVGGPDGKDRHFCCQIGFEKHDKLELKILWEKGACHYRPVYSIDNSKFAFFNKCLIVQTTDIWNNNISIDISC